MDWKRRAIFCAVLASATVLAGSCSASPSATPSMSAPALEVVVTTDMAAELRYVPAEVSVPAHTAVRLTFRNVSTQAHNLTIDAPISRGTRTIVEAGGSDTFDLVTPAPGRYSFVCTIHMGMSGTLTVK
jgi:plastocyanin